jgi:UDP-GlcNAc3NAcA epimerase
MIEKKSKVICTDSGGVQKEAFFFAKPCIILRDETEWTELTQHTFAKLAGNSYEKIIDSFNYFYNNKSNYSLPLFGNGNSAEFICEKIISNFE